MVDHFPYHSAVENRKEAARQLEELSILSSFPIANRAQLMRFRTDSLEIFRDLCELLGWNSSEAGPKLDLVEFYAEFLRHFNQFSL